jgi:hypothetical protein
MYGPEGKLVTLAISDEAAPADCQSTELPVPAAAVRWFTLTDIPPGAAPRNIGLQGYFDGMDVRVSEVIHAQPEVQNERGYLPFNVDLQPYLQARAFGLEERATADGRRLHCAAGGQIAGISLHSDFSWEQLPGMQLELRVNGNGEFSLAIEDATRAAAERPLTLGSVKVDGGTATLMFALPGNAERWSNLVFFCPAAEATLVLDSLKLVPRAPVATRGRATWLWEPQLWRDRPEFAWQLAQQERLTKFFITVPTAGASVAEPERLAAFISAAKVRDIEVWAVAGDRGDVLPEQLQPLLDRAEAYRHFNAEYPEAQLAGLQLDIEPYLLPGITLAPDYWRERYIVTVTAVHAKLENELPLDLVMPVWWGLHPAWGARLLDAVVLPGLSLTVMNYRTNADALRVGAMPFLAWGQAHERSVAMALEKGRVGVNSGNGRDETRIDYAASPDRGEVWLLELGGMTLLLLLDGEREGLPGQAYAKSAERVISLRSVSFADVPDNLQAIAATLEAEWSAWDAFSGLAIHGLDQVDREGR